MCSNTAAVGVSNNRMKQGFGVASDMTGEVGAAWRCTVELKREVMAV